MNFGCTDACLSEGLIGPTVSAPSGSIRDQNVGGTAYRIAGKDLQLPGWRHPLKGFLCLYAVEQVRN
jgi:hypothetical protein